jgi:hypothetical protein
MKNAMNKTKLEMLVDESLHDDELLRVLLPKTQEIIVTISTILLYFPFSSALD